MSSDFIDKRKDIKRRRYTEKEFNNFLNKQLPPSVTKCGMTAAQIIDRWRIPRQQAYGLTRRFGMRVMGNLVIPYEVTRSPEFIGTIGYIMKKQAKNRREKEE